MDDAHAKWNVKDFMQHMGLEYSNQLIIDESIDRSRIVPSNPSYIFDVRFANAIKSGYEVPAYLKFISARVGYGVFAEAPINEDDIVGEYTGRLMTGKVARALPSDQIDYLYSVDSCYESNNWLMPLFIDAKNVGNSTRFINHSYAPNVSQKTFFDGVIWHIIFVAAQRIEKDQQLFMNYGKGYWQAREIEPIDLTANP